MVGNSLIQCIIWEHCFNGLYSGHTFTVLLSLRLWRISKDSSLHTNFLQVHVLLLKHRHCIYQYSHSLITRLLSYTHAKVIHALALELVALGINQYSHCGHCGVQISECCQFYYIYIHNCRKSLNRGQYNYDYVWYPQVSPLSIIWLLLVQHYMCILLRILWFKPHPYWPWYNWPLKIHLGRNW